MKVASVFMGSLIFPWKDAECVCVWLSHPFSCFQQLCLAIDVVSFTCTVELLHSSIHLFRSLFALWRVFAYLLGCLLACICEHFVPLFSSRHHMFSSYRRMYVRFFLFACVPDQYTKCHLCRPKRRRQ